MLRVGQKVCVFTGTDGSGAPVYRYGTLLKLPDPKWANPGEVEYENGRREWVDHTTLSDVESGGAK